MKPPSYSQINTVTFLKALKMKIHVVEFAHSVDPDEAAHDELAHLDLHCLPSSL